MTYYFLTQEDKKRTDRIDALLAQVTSRWNAELMRKAKEVVLAPERVKTTVDSERGRRRLPPPPPGWGTDENAARTSIAAAKMLNKR